MYFGMEFVYDVDIKSGRGADVNVPMYSSRWRLKAKGISIRCIK